MLLRSSHTFGEAPPAQPVPSPAQPVPSPASGPIHTAVHPAPASATPANPGLLHTSFPLECSWQTTGRLPAQFTPILPSHLDSHYAWASDNLLRLHDGAKRTSSRNCMVFVRKPGGSTDWNGTSPHHFLTCQRQDVQVALDHFSWTERNGTASMGKALTI